MKLDPNFSEFVHLLNANAVEYLIVGGYAVAWYGYPRFTGDFDVWIRPTVENARNVLTVMRMFGFASLGFTEEDFIKPDMVLQIGYPPLRIDILTSIDGVEFEECYAAKKLFTVNGGTVDVISLEHLKANKRKSGRHKDLDDLEHL